MDRNLQDLLRISNAVGADPRLVQGGGGNTSVKTDGGRLMYVKASGTSLAEMREGRGYRLVEVQACAAVVEDEELGDLPAAEREARVLARLLDSCVDELEGRPSVETSLHAMLGRCVVHTHPSVVNGFLCARDGRQAIADALGSLKPPCLYVGFAGAGYTLARRLRRELDAYRAEQGRLPEVIFLENHGLVVNTEDAARAIAVTRQVFDTLEEVARAAAGQATLPPFSPLPRDRRDAVVAETAAVMRRFYTEAFGRPALVRFDDGRTVTDFLRLPQATDLIGAGPLIPDQVIYCRGRPLWIEASGSGEQFRADLGAALREAEAGLDTPLCALVAGVGLFCAAPGQKLLGAVCATTRAVLESLSVAAYFGGARGLSEETLGFLRGWEVERFRRRMAAGEVGGGDLDGKVALVTGAGSGLGRGISLFLARRGMHVVLADIDEDGALETAGRIERQGSLGSGHPVRTDVTSESAVRDLVVSAIRALGGVDILVNCAGVAPVSPLTEFPLAD
ncbi:MAG: SDR family NAD(P)-dependent oxidoreductase, partial [Planctomycetota bacterium]